MIGERGLNNGKSLDSNRNPTRIWRRDGASFRYGGLTLKSHHLPIRFFNRSHNQHCVRQDIADRKKERAVYDHLECTYSWPAAFGRERHRHKCRCGSLRALFVDLNEGTVEDRPTQRFLVAQSIPKFYEYLAGAIPVKAAEGDAVVDQIAAVGNVERGY
jgi:hypothetical protein